MFEYKYTYRQLADKIGVGESTVSMWRKNDTIPRADDAVKIANLLETTVEYLITGEYEGGLTSEQRKMIQRYFVLDERDKEMVQAIIDTMYERAHSEFLKKHPIDTTKPVIIENEEELISGKFEESDEFWKKEGEVRELEPEYKAFEDTPILDTNVLPVDYDMVYLPYFGKTAAGTPLDIFVEPGEYMPFPRKALKGDPEDYFVLSIQGYSMVKADIDEGDMVVIRHTEEPVHGKVMLVRYEGASTLKRLAYRGGKWHLLWEDGSDREIQVDSGGFQVQGLHVWTLKPGK